MKKLFSFAVALFVSLAVGAQTVIDISTIDAAYTTTVDGNLVIDVAKTASKVATPKLSFTNPFKGKTFSEAEISFDVYNYGDIKVLGSLFGLFDATLGRMYYSNGSYLGYNATGGWLDANMINYGMGTNFIGSTAWKNVKLQFTATGYAMYIDNVVAFNQSSTNVTIGGTVTDYTKIISFLQNASTLVFGTGSWWSDNTKEDGITYWDAQNSYLKNIKFRQDFTASIDQTKSDSNSELVGEEFFSVTGARVGTDYSTLEPGTYIKKSVYSNGTINSSKIAKAQ